MTNSALQRAIDALSIRDVFIAKSESYLAEGFEPRYGLEADDLRVAWKHQPVRSEVLHVDVESGEAIMLFRVTIEVGARFTAEDRETESEAAEGSSDDAPPTKECARIEASFIAEYEMPEELDAEAQRAFALNNASYHVWPYWREYLMSQCARMNLPKLTLPTVQFSRNRAASSSSAD